MSPRHAASQDPRTPHEVAGDWWLMEAAGRLTPLDAVERGRWLDADPAHQTAWDDVRLAMATVADNAADPELMAMRAAALAVRGEPRWGLRGLVAAGVVLVVALGALTTVGLRQAHSPAPVLASGGVAAPALQGGVADPNSALYRTAVGERAAITLPDGSIATLDTNSLLKVAYTAAERRVTLVRGQALFEVAKHKPIPFLVAAGDRRILAVGTKFDVRLDGSGPGAKVSVALLEGVVRVTSVAGAGAPPETVTMAAGEVLEAAPDLPVRVAAADTRRVASWQDGVLSFDDQPLGQAVAEMNRYTTRPIAIADPAIARLRVSGVFKTGDPEHFAETMAEAFPLRVAHDAAGEPVLKPRE